MIMKKYYYLFLLVVLMQNGNANTTTTFRLIGDNINTSLYYTGNEKVINTALDMLIDDSRHIGNQPFSRTEEIKNQTVIVGIPEKEKDLKQLVLSYNISIDDLDGKWEGYKIHAVENDKQSLLFVLGSDPRGTAYGILELSRQMGITPWIWWADVVPDRKTEVVINANGIVYAPSVQYRGIFLNDEDWALMPWSTRTFEPTPVHGAMGPKTYAKIFELMLRLRANTIWPAMHECTIPFFFVEGNKEVAEKYAIVLSTSHAEPMMRTNTGEWNSSERGAFNFLTNRDSVLSYWEERTKQLVQTENIYTIGMRGIHDGRMQGVSSLDDETQTLFKVIDEQRNMLQRNNPERNISDIPQIFVPYKEVLKAYDNGLTLPDDVTLVWCDDNSGYIMRLSSPEEKKRSGGSGVYYHVSYWGKPHDYLWLGSTQPGLIYAEMKRAWDNDARRFWILNVGDIKPNEYLTEFFLDMAWDINAFKGNTIYKHQEEWLKRTFTGISTEEINKVIKKYYHLAGQRKPEHMAWNKVEDQALRNAGVRGGLQPVKDTELSPFVFGDEIRKRIDEYEAIAEQSKEIYNNMSITMKPSYFQLVHYPVLASAAMNKKTLYAQKARLYAESNPAAARTYSDMAIQAYNEIAALDYTYNKDMLNGKWELMMDMKPRDLPVFQQPVLPNLPNGSRACINSLPVTGEYVRSANPYIESDKMISLNASQHTNDVEYEIIEGLGHSSSAVRLPAPKGIKASNISSRTLRNAPHLEFKVTTTSSGIAKIKIGTIPWHPVNGGEMRCAIVVNNKAPQQIVINAEFLTDKWAENVLRNQALNFIESDFDKPGEHIIRIYAIDEEILVDQIMIEFDPERSHYIIPVHD